MVNRHVNYGTPQEECFACERSGRAIEVDKKTGELKPAKFARLKQMDAFASRQQFKGGLMIIGTHPEQEACENNIHFYSEQRLILDNTLLKEARIPPTDVVYTYACKCRVKGVDRGPTSKHIRACKYRLLAEIEYYKPKLIIAMGKSSMEMFQEGGYNKIKDIRGTGSIFKEIPEKDEADKDKETILKRSVPVFYTYSLNVFDPHHTPPTAKPGDEETTSRDQRQVVIADFKWIGKIYNQDMKYLKPREAFNFKANYTILKIDSSKDQFDAALDIIEMKQTEETKVLPRDIISYDVETVGGKCLIPTTVSFTPTPGVSFVFPILQKMVPNHERNKCLIKYEEYYKPTGNILIDNNRKKLTSIFKKNKKERTKKGEEVYNMAKELGGEFIIENPDTRVYVFNRIKSIMENSKIYKVAHNGNYDAHAMLTVGIKVRGWIHDTMHMYSVIDEESVRNLKDLTDMYIDRLRGYDSLLARFKHNNNISSYYINIPYGILGPYNAMDTDATLCLYFQFRNMILNGKTEEESKEWAFYMTYAMDLQKVMHQLECEGCLIDVDFIEKRYKDNIKHLIELGTRIITFVKDVHVFKPLSLDNINELTGMMDESTDECKAGFKVSGNDNVAQVLKSKKVVLQKKTKYGKFQVTAEVLEELKEHPVVGEFVKDVLKFREVAKHNSFFKDYIIKKDDTNRVYSSFNVHGAVTGRFTCAKPNLQQLPRDKNVKNMIIAPDGYNLVQADLSQAELRILAHYADEISMKQVFTGFTATCVGASYPYIFIQDKTAGSTNFFYGFRNTRNGAAYCFEGVPDRPDLLHVLGKVNKVEPAQRESFKIASDSFGGNIVIPMTPVEFDKEFMPGDIISTGAGDIHMYVGSEIYDTVIWKLQKEERSQSKSVSFGIPYGISAFALGLQIGKPREEAQALMNLYFKHFPRVKQYIDDTIKEAFNTAYHSTNKVGVVTTEMGRKRHLNDILSTNGYRKSHACRQAVNFKIQATCHDLITMHIIKIDEEIKKRGSGALFVNQVHDSVMYYCPEKETSEFCKWLKDIMELPYLNSGDLVFTADVDAYARCWSGKKLDL